MPDIIFARPDHTYESYSDFWRLVELSSFPIITIGDIDPQSDNCYIFSTPSTHWHDGTERHGWPDAKAKIIYYGIEWYLDVDYTAIPGVECWFADAWFAALKGGKYVPLGSHPGLKLHDESPNGRIYDVIGLFAPSVNRYEAYGQLARHNVTIAPNAWGDVRHRMLLQSRAMLHIHQWADKPTVAPQRFALAAAYGLPLITETLANPGIFIDGKRLMTGLSDIGRFTAEWMQTDKADELAGYGAALHELLCVEWGFRRVIEGAL